MPNRLFIFSRILPLDIQYSVKYQNTVFGTALVCSHQLMCLLNIIVHVVDQCMDSSSCSAGVRRDVRGERLHKKTSHLSSTTKLSTRCFLLTRFLLRTALIYNKIRYHLNVLTSNAVCVVLIFNICLIILILLTFEPQTSQLKHSDIN